MAIKIRIADEDGSLKEQTLTTHGILTQKKMDFADKLDEKIKKRVRKIEKDAKDKGLLDLKSKKGKVIQLYYFVGTELKSFVDDIKLPKTEKEHIWNPINFHAKELSVSISTKRQTRDRAYGSVWNNCYRLASYSKKDVLEFDWTQWVEIFDSKITRNDPRVVNWLIETKRKYHKDGPLQNWFRTLMKVIRDEFTISRDIETTWLTKRELSSQLSACRKKFIQIWKKKIAEEKKKSKSKK